MTASSASEAVHSPFNACSYRDECRKQASEIERLRAEVESARSDHAFATIGWERERGLREAAEARALAAEAALAAERERCAKVAEELGPTLDGESSWYASNVIAAAIRTQIAAPGAAMEAQ